MFLSCLVLFVAVAGALAQSGAAEARYAAGVNHLQQGRYEEAKAALLQAVGIDPGSAAAWKALGVAHASQGEYPSAEAALGKACGLDAKLPDACFYHGRTLYLVNRFVEALAVLGRLSGDSRRYRVQALCQDALGHWKEAEALYRKAIESDTGGEDPKIDYAVALMRQGRTEAALPLLAAAVQSKRQLQRAELEMGRALLRLGRTSEARLHLEHAVALAPGSAQAHLLLGRVYAQLGLAEAAERHLRLGAKSPPEQREN